MLAPPPLPRTLEACFRDLGSRRPEVRAHAAEELGRHLGAGVGDARARGVDALVGALRDEHPGVRARAATAMADAGATEALATLLVAVEDEDGLVRQMALSALGELGDARSAPKLRRALRDERPEVRYQAVIAFARVSPDDAEAALLAALDDADPAVRHIALRVTEERHDEGHPAPPRALEAAARLLDDEHGDVAVAAAILLAKVGDARARPRLMQVVERRVPGLGPEEEQGAVEACGLLGLREALPALERRAFGLGRLLRPSQVYPARLALAALGHARALSDLLTDLASSRPEVRDRAIMGAGRARVRGALAALERLAREPDANPLAREALALIPDGEGGG